MTRTIKNTDCFEYLVLEDKKNIYDSYEQKLQEEGCMCVF